MKLTTIVAGTDFSPTSKPAVDQSVALAAQHRAKLLLVHGTSFVDSDQAILGAGAQVTSAWHEFVRKHLRTVEQNLFEVAEHCRRAGIEVEPRLVHDYADTALVSVARESKADLVVVGTHGYRGADRLLLGSVAERAIRQLSCHVLVARAATPARGRFEHVLCPTDFSETAECGLAAAIALAAPGTIDVVHCWEPPVFYGFVPPADLVARMREESAAQAEKLCGERSRPHKRLRFGLVDATPVDGIVQLTESGKHEIVVIGSHGRRGVRRWLLGSVAEAVMRRAPISVLIAHGETA